MTLHFLFSLGSFWYLRVSDEQVGIGYILVSTLPRMVHFSLTVVGFQYNTCSVGMRYKENVEIIIITHNFKMSNIMQEVKIYLCVWFFYTPCIQMCVIHR